MLLLSLTPAPSMTGSGSMICFMSLRMWSSCVHTPYEAFQGLLIRVAVTVREESRDSAAASGPATWSSSRMTRVCFAWADNRLMIAHCLKIGRPLSLSPYSLSVYSHTWHCRDCRTRTGHCNTSPSPTPDSYKQDAHTCWSWTFSSQTPSEAHPPHRQPLALPLQSRCANTVSPFDFTGSSSRRMVSGTEYLLGTSTMSFSE